jgi:DegV family protein with EDD domain
MNPSLVFERVSQSKTTNVKIVTDSLADIPPNLLDELDITNVPCLVRFGNTEYRDRVDLPPRAFYEKLKASSVLPTTAAPSCGEFEDVYQQLSQKTDEILAIHTIGSLSGIYNASRLAAKEFPNVQIELVDSRQVSMSLGWLVILAARAAQAGKRLDEIKALVQNALHRVHIVAMLDTLEYAQRGGRLGKGAALVGTLLNVKPLLSAERGEIVPVENVRSHRRAMERLVEIILNSGPVEEIAVVHANALDYAERLREMLGRVYPSKSILVSETGPVLGTHAGPGAIGIAWLSEKNGKGW